MKPFVLAACLAALLIAVAQLAPPLDPRVISVPPTSGAGANPQERSSDAPNAAPCPRGSLPDEGVCVPVPAASANPDSIRRDDN
ncbi:MAG TPA: hypothetical protein VHO25_15165 [Polyangiaceae bacterium]|nr:hypothetical protein [Polyangiaceae bacterium]